MINARIPLIIIKKFVNYLEIFLFAKYKDDKFIT